MRGPCCQYAFNAKLARWLSPVLRYVYVTTILTFLSPIKIGGKRWIGVSLITNPVQLLQGRLFFFFLDEALLQGAWYLAQEYLGIGLAPPLLSSSTFCPFASIIEARPTGGAGFFIRVLAESSVIKVDTMTKMEG